MQQSEVELQGEKAASCPSPCQYQTEAHKGRNHPLSTFSPPNPDDPAAVAVGSKLVEIRSKKKKKWLKWLIVKPSVSDERLGAPRMVQLEERQWKGIHESPPCNTSNPPDPEALD